jgi:hypothetical protein
VTHSFYFSGMTSKHKGDSFHSRTDIGYPDYTALVGNEELPFPSAFNYNNKPAKILLPCVEKIK